MVYSIFILKPLIGDIAKSTEPNGDENIVSVTMQQIKKFLFQVQIFGVSLLVNLPEP